MFGFGLVSKRETNAYAGKQKFIDARKASAG